MSRLIWSESSLGAHPFYCFFFHVAAQMQILRQQNCKFCIFTELKYIQIICLLKRYLFKNTTVILALFSDRVRKKPNLLCSLQSPYIKTDTATEFKIPVVQMECRDSGRKPTSPSVGWILWQSTWDFTHLIQISLFKI